MRRILILFLLTVSIMPVFAQIKVGQPAPELSLPDLQGNRVSLSALKGKLVLIDFWASWCGPCRQNNPHLVRLYRKYHDKGLEIYGISIDDNPEAWKKAVSQDKLTWIQVNDIKGWDAPSAILYGVDAIPASCLIDREGVVRKINAVGWDLESEIKKCLKP